jgi:hypothetical protein
MRLHRLTLLAALSMILMSAQSSKAVDLYWQWSFTDSVGLQQGYFVTDGGPFSSANPASGTYNVLNFIVTSSPNMAIGSITTTPISTGGVYNEGTQPGTGFIWNNGTAAATQFFRDNGALTNGTNYYQVGATPDDRFTFGISGSSMIGRAKSSGTFAPLTLQAVATPVPEPSTYALGAIGTIVFGLVARRRRRSKSA